MKLFGRLAKVNGNRSRKSQSRRQAVTPPTRGVAVAWGQVAKVLRGGSWNNNANNVRAPNRNNNNPNNQNNNMGLRCAR